LKAGDFLRKEKRVRIALKVDENRRKL